MTTFDMQRDAICLLVSHFEIGVHPPTFVLEVITFFCVPLRLNGIIGNMDLSFVSYFVYQSNLGVLELKQSD